MAIHRFLWAWCLLWIHSHALPQTRYVPRDATSGPVWNSCGDLIREASAADNPSGIVYAVDVYNCWATVPFNPAVATRFLKYWNDTLQFQSSLEWLKHPPAGYQKPAVDLVAGLQQIQNTVDSGQYTSEYEFEADFQRLLYSANDDHVGLNAGLLSSFKFANPYGLTTLSLDGIALPKTYTTYDLYLNQTKGPQATWQPSAISHINGKDATEYLSDFAALNAGGSLEPHADWNTMLDNPVLDVLSQFTSFQGYATFYPGDEFTFQFENGTSITDRWLAIYNWYSDTGPLETGGDFYNFFVLGFYPASYNPPNVTTTAAVTSSAAPTPISYADVSVAYPAHADIFQANLTITGFVTGYFYPVTSLAVLSIPTFAMDGDAIQAFSDAVQQFVGQAKARGLRKVVIDLQENAGGDVILAYNTFKQFFPSITPYGGSQRRATPLANTLGTTISKYCGSLSPSDDDYIACAGDDWDALVVLNAATGKNFTSWQELYGPKASTVDKFTLTQRLDTQSSTYDYVNLGYQSPPAPLFQTAGASPWAASDVIILSNALCSSACSLFLEFMRFDAGVRNVVVGGRPTDGPMQTPSRSRAARYYSLLELDTDIANLVALNVTENIPNRNDQTLFINWGGISIRDQIGPNTDVPYQMQYQAADCRIYFTPSTFSNFTNLWQYAADAIWSRPGYCVQGSTGKAPTATGGGAPALSVPAGVNYDQNGIVGSGTKTAQNIPLMFGHGPQPDAPVPVNVRIRPARRISNVDNPSRLGGTTAPPPPLTEQQITQQKQDEAAANCRLFTSERASAQCLRRVKRSMIKRSRR